jgi:chlorophyllide a oxygenase
MPGTTVALSQLLCSDVHLRNIISGGKPSASRARLLASRVSRSEEGSSASVGSPQNQNFLEVAPQIRLRRASDRAKEQLADLAVLNERLSKIEDGSGAGMEDVVKARKRVEFMKRSRKTWSKVYEYLMDNDVDCTVSAIEDANSKVMKMLRDETLSVMDQQQSLESLKQKTDEASDRLRRTEAEIELNMQRLEEIKAAARILEESVNPGAEAESLDALAPGRKKAPANGLHSSLELEPALKNHWFAVQFSSKLVEDTLIPFELFGEQWVLFRDQEGKAAAVQDECAHRACPLSAGRVVEGSIECPYHGWTYDRAGACTKMPSTKMCSGIKVKSLPVVECDGMVWVWPGCGEPIGSPEGLAAPPEGFEIHAEIEVEVPVDSGLLVENLLDLAHAPFTHQGTFAKGWKVPDVVQFTAQAALSGFWSPYPIDMEFRPPCQTVSKIGLARPGEIMRNVQASDCQNHLVQYHWCLPSRPGHTRLLYRMSMDFMGWIRYIPGIKSVWESVAGQVLGEDLVLVLGQQDRMQRGGNTWANPVSYDKMAVRYRRWRNKVAEEGASLEDSQPIRMNAGELFGTDLDS